MFVHGMSNAKKILIGYADMNVAYMILQMKTYYNANVLYEDANANVYACNVYACDT